MLKTYGHDLAKELGKGTPKPFFHTDAAQALGKIPIDVNEAGIDLMSMSSHKLYGPKGIGACFVRRRPRVRLEPLISGGGQERGLRSGTLATPLVVGFGEAARLAKNEMAVRIFHCLPVKDETAQAPLVHATCAAQVREAHVALVRPMQCTSFTRWCFASMSEGQLLQGT